ncbi:Gfo/Idh/MocA family protein [Planctomycetes bacterium K23_9]|uniref:Inositol 2-dehydrogenase n=1 Tax=Stieleria marina TaxID=1930275 RepID=A0A517NMW0_9BACT|nr:Inositol 2-dehydrogenase [Planctomycetes bacterium K23_9]
MHQQNRRSFLATSAGACGFAAGLASSIGSGNERSSNDRINLGVIGLGSRGYNLIDEFLRLDGCRIVAVCDVDEFHHRDRAWGKGIAFGRIPAMKKIDQAYAKQAGKVTQGGIKSYSDYRELIRRDDIDAVVIATPDHWHAKCTIDSLAAGKDVYCEKPVTHLFHEGQLVYQEVAKQKAIFQTGSQQRSDEKFRRAVEIARNGLLGEIHAVEVGLPMGYEKPQGDTAVAKPPKQLDYDFWCGPSEVLPYMRARHHRWWRGHRAYGGGVLMDWIGHHNDIAHWALDVDQSGPESVEAVDWTFPEGDVYNTPANYTLRCEYEGGIQSSISVNNRQGLKLIGSDGWVFVTRGKLESSHADWSKPDFVPGRVKVYASDNHAKNFLDCIRSREACISPAQTTHRSITPGHLGYVSNAVGRKLKWDATNELIVGDDEASKLLMEINYRQPWSLT